MTKTALEEIIKDKDRIIEERQGLINTQIESCNELQEENARLCNELEENNRFNMAYNHDYSYHRNLEEQVRKLTEELKHKEEYSKQFDENNLYKENKTLKDHIVKLSMRLQ